MSNFSVFQQGNAFNLATTSVRGGSVTQVGGPKSLSIASGFNNNTIGGSGKALQFGTAGNDSFTVQNSGQNGKFYLNGAGGSDALNLPKGTIQYGNAFFNPATKTGVYAVGFSQVNYFS